MFNQLSNTLRDGVPATVPAGFVHLPGSASTAPADAPHLPDESLARAVRRCVDLVFEPEGSVPGGAIW